MSDTNTTTPGAVVTPTTTPATPPAPPTPPAPSAPAEGVFTAADMTKARQEEKDKLYGRLETLANEVAEIKAAEAAARQQAQAAADEAARAQREREEAEMSAKDLFTKKESEWNSMFETHRRETESRIEQVEQARQEAEALLQKERRFQELEAYRSARLSENVENIMPELADLVSGNSEAEIDASIATVVEKTAAIVASVQAASGSRPRSVSTGAPTDTSVIDNPGGQKKLTAEDIRAMDMNEYQKHRASLLQAAGQQRRTSY